MPRTAPSTRIALLGGAGSELGALGEQPPLVGVLGEQGDGARELVAGGVGATDEHRNGHALELLGVEPIARLLSRDQVGQQVVGRCHTPSLDELVHVRAHLGLRGLDEWQVFEDVVVEDPE